MDVVLYREIDQPPGRCDKDMDPVPQFGFLNFHGESAEDGKGHDLRQPRNLMDLIDVLKRQFAGGYQDQGLDGVDGGIDRMDEGNAAGPGFAGPGLCPGQEIPAAQDGLQRSFPEWG